VSNSPAPDSALATATPEQQRLRVLIVDDNADDRSEQRGLLLSGLEMRFSFSEADLGASAIAAVRASAEGPPDCVLLDYYLPDMDALEVLAALRDSDGAVVCPVVVLTGSNDPQLGRQVLRCGAQDHLPKRQLTSSSLVRAMAHAMERWAMARDLRQSMAMLVEREREFRALADNSPDVLTRFDRQLRHVFVNNAITRITGLAPAELIGKTNRELDMPMPLAEQWEEALQSVFITGQPRSLEFSFDGLAGRQHFSSRLVPESAADGSVEHVLSVTHDVTALHQLEQQARDSAERLQLAMAAGNAVAWSLDIEGDRIEGSDELERQSQREIPHRSDAYHGWMAGVHPDNRTAVNAALQSAIHAEGTDCRFEFRTEQTRDGNPIWMLALSRVERDAAGTARRLVGISIDITERRKLEQELRDVDRHKDEFIAMLGHELRGPLAPLRNGLFLLKQEPLGSDVADGVRAMMERQLQHLMRLVDDLLDVSRIGTGKLALQRAHIRLQTIVEHAVEASHPLISSRDQRLEMQVADQPVWLDGDLTRLAQVLSNLLANAAKYTPRGGSIVLFAGVEGSNAVMRVSDSGRGIAPSMQGRIFDMFRQVDGPNENSGLGIGLSVVRQLLQMHGGDVECHSAGISFGSTFTAWLPLYPSAEPADDAGNSGIAVDAAETGTAQPGATEGR